jgi:hypothetical protein
MYDTCDDFDEHKKTKHNFWTYIKYFLYLANNFKNIFFFKNPFKGKK